MLLTTALTIVLLTTTVNDNIRRVPWRRGTEQTPDAPRPNSAPMPSVWLPCTGQPRRGGSGRRRGCWGREAQIQKRATSRWDAGITLLVLLVLFVVVVVVDAVFALGRCFYPSTSSTPSIPTTSSPYVKAYLVLVQVMW